MSKRMNVYLSFDIEVWCNDWKDLDRRFPRSFERYIYGRSAKGEYALPKTLEILERHGLKGVFFVEPLFAARFGVEHLGTIVDLIRAGGHDIELHIHPEWSDELRPIPFPGATRKRQNLFSYSRDEQATLIRLGLDLLGQVGCTHINAFRAGGFACNADTFRAVVACGLAIDSSLNSVYPTCASDLRGSLDLSLPQHHAGLALIPVTVFRDGTGRLRPAQVGACSFAELRETLDAAQAANHGHFMLLSHNFEMLKQDSSAPDRIVVKRFESLCQYLADHADRFNVSTLERTPELPALATPTPGLTSSLGATFRRHGEQLLRRAFG